MKYKPWELQKILDSMVVLVDTREQPGDRFNRRAEGFGYPFERCKLNFGDYSCKYIDIDGSEVTLAHRIAIERKMDANELAMCFGKERSRFQREFERAKETGARIYLIVEEENWEKIYTGKYGKNDKYRSRLNPRALKASILAWSIRYGLHTHFCKAETTGSLIGDILHYELKELLEST